MSRELSVNRDDEENNWGDDWGDEDVCKFGDNDNEMSDLRNDNKTDFEQMEYNAVVDMRNRMVDEVADLISQPNKEVVSLLLRAFNWNQEKFSEQFLEQPKKIMDDAGLYFSQTVVECGNDEVECRICDGDFKRNECHTVGCGHWFCFQCWEIYLTNKIQVEGYACVLTKCPSYKCLATVPDATFKEILCNKNPEKKEIFSRYERFVVRSFVEHSKSLRWCSAPKCERVIRARGNPKTVICSCGYKFCFKCNEEPHAPASCQQVASWKIKCRDESETAHWILANTRQCPKCNVRIEKNQGCNHMICRSCKYEFCWVCFGPWSEHSHDTGGFYKCNVFDPKKLKVQKENEVAESIFNAYFSL
jgi:ariadne-1